ncbi:MAG: hypothetical protein ACRD0N_02385, partial [Acidimicrobiales bacterium]
ATVPGDPVTMAGVVARLDCPPPPDPNGPGNFYLGTFDYPAGLGSATPEAALRSQLEEWPGADPASFVATARSASAVRYENRHAAVIVAGTEGALWVVESVAYCVPVADEWRAGRG